MLGVQVHQKHIFFTPLPWMWAVHVMPRAFTHIQSLLWVYSATQSLHRSSARSDSFAIRACHGSNTCTGHVAPSASSVSDMILSVLTGALFLITCAGEFCIMPDDRAAAGHKLVLDNNSGTYAPHKAKLHLLQQLFTVNFPDMTVEVLDMRAPMLTYYQSLCPSRSLPAPAAPVAVAMPNRRAPQFMAG